MVSNDELLAKLEIINEAIMKNRMDISGVKQALVSVLNVIGKAKVKEIVEKTATVGPGLIITEDPNYGDVSPKEIVKKPNAPKLPANGRIPNSYKIAKKECSYCEGIVAWPRVFVTDKEVEEGKTRDPPIHCDIDGNIIGNGRCPNL